MVLAHLHAAAYPAVTETILTWSTCTPTTAATVSLYPAQTVARVRFGDSPSGLTGAEYSQK